MRMGSHSIIMSHCSSILGKDAWRGGAEEGR